MVSMIRSWRQARRYRAVVAGLRALSADELKAHWIAPRDIPDLARKAARL
jgi:hypothetical protein